MNPSDVTLLERRVELLEQLERQAHAQLKLQLKINDHLHDRIVKLEKK